MGFDKRILDNNAKYVDSWIDTLKQEPKFIVSVMADVSKASAMILEYVDKQRLELGKTALLPKDAVLDEKGQEVKDPKAEKDDKEAKAEKQPTKAEQKAELNREMGHVWNDLKEKHPDALLLMRKGDFYEAFGEDAKKVAKSTGLKEQHVVKEGFSDKEQKEGEKGISYVNFKNTSLDKYLPKLVRDGHRVAIVDNLEDMAKQRIDDRKAQESKEAKVAKSTVDVQQNALAGKTIPLDQFNKLETEDGKKIDHFAVFKMKSGNYGVRAMVDGQQLSVKAMNKEDRNAFFEHTTTQPKQEQRSRAMGM